MGGRSRNSRKKYRKTKPQRILIRCGFLVGAGGLKEPGSRLPAAASCLERHAHPAGRSPNSSSLFPPQAAVGSAAVRIHPCSPFCKTDKTETPVPGSDTGVLGGRGWIARAAHLKKPRRGFFPRRTIRRVDAVRIHPPYEFSLVTKQKPQRTCIR